MPACLQLATSSQGFIGHGLRNPGIQSIPWSPLIQWILASSSQYGTCSQVVNGRELAEHVAIEGPMRESVARGIFLQVSPEGFQFQIMLQIGQ